MVRQRARIAAYNGILPRELVERVAEILTRYSMLPPGGRIGIAVSGGADSVVLLHLLHRLRSQFAASFLVLHVNHQLRGNESEGDEAFVRDLAGTLGYPVVAARLPPAEGNLEEQARECRRRFFLQAKEEHALHAVALGHTRSDQAETVLFRILRGTGNSGLAAMRFASRSGFVRPLLETSRQEIREWARSEGLRWREDATNGDLSFTRNRLRNVTLPELANQYNPNLEATLAGMARIAQDEESYWDALCAPIAADWSRRTRFGWELPLGPLKALPVAQQRRILRICVQKVKGDLKAVDAKHIEAILSICVSAAGHDRVLIPGVDALRSFETLLLTHPGHLAQHDRGYQVEVNPGEDTVLPYGIGVVSLNRVSISSHFCANFKGTLNFPIETVALDEDALLASAPAASLYIRNWQPGDEIKRPGHQRPEKLKSLFQEQKVLLWQRRHWPVLVAGDTIAWVRQFGCAAGFQGLPSSRSLLRLSYNDAEASA